MDARISAGLRSYGRRRGRRPSARQSQLLREALPRLGVDLSGEAPSDLGALFPNSPADVWLEIGFGGAEHLIWQASRNPNVGFIGCEPFEDGVVKALSAAEENSLANLRLHADDARPLLRWLPPASIGRAFVLFPDPWPKKKHVKRRLVNSDLLERLARVLKPGAELRLATDIGGYARAMLLAVHAHTGFFWSARSPADWRERPADWPPTRYEEKARAAGRRPYFFRVMRTTVLQKT